MKNTIFLLVDRLHIGYLGGYGNAEIETPTLDRLFSESFVSDRFYVDTPDPIRQCRSWWRGVPLLDQRDTPSIISQLNRVGYQTVLLTDDPSIAYSPDAGDFSDVQLLPLSENREPCIEIVETHLCAVVATIASTAESLAHSGKPFSLWCHLRGFDATWDFPLVLREKYRGDDGDPEPWAGVTPPFYRCEKRNEPPDDFHDFRQAVVSTYAGGMTMFDELLEMLTEPLRNGDLGKETLFLLAGTRGILFGEHGIIGIPSVQSGEIEPLASSLVQTPLSVRFPDGFGATVRSDTLLQPQDMTRLLYEWLAIPFPDMLPPPFYDEPFMLNSIREYPQKQRDHILVVASSYRTTANDVFGCLATPSWYLQELTPSSETAHQFALYVKPDDRWDVNNVADRCFEIVKQLVEERAGLFRRLAGNAFPE